MDYYQKEALCIYRRTSTPQVHSNFLRRWRNVCLAWNYCKWVAFLGLSRKYHYYLGYLIESNTKVESKGGKDAHLKSQNCPSVFKARTEHSGRENQINGFIFSVCSFKGSRRLCQQRSNAILSFQIMSVVRRQCWKIGRRSVGMKLLYRSSSLRLTQEWDTN